MSKVQDTPTERLTTTWQMQADYDRFLSDLSNHSKEFFSIICPGDQKGMANKKARPTGDPGQG